MNGKNITIICLFASSLILLTLLTITQMFVAPTPVFAGSMQASGGDYIATISRVTQGAEALWVLDCRTKTVGIYQYDNGSRSLELRTTFTIKELGE